jgi:hypothetical protein
MQNNILKIFFLLAIFLMLPNFSKAAIYFQDNFDGYADSPTNHGWGITSAANVENGDSPDGGRVLKFTIQTRGTAQYWSEFDPNPNGTFEDGYIGFWAKEVGHTDGTAGGVKWLKLFSADYSATYANVTFGQGYGDGMFGSIGSGEGSGLTNDTQTGYRMSGTVSAGNWSVGTSYTVGNTTGYGTNKIYSCKLNHVATTNDQPGIGANWTTYWDLVGTIVNSSVAFYAGEGWHYYEYYMKHNTDNNFDGEFASWRDGELKIRVTGVRNRNNANSMDWDSASLVNHVEIAAPTEYYIYFDDIKTSDTYMEYVPPATDSVAPSAPSGIGVM